MMPMPRHFRIIMLRMLSRVRGPMFDVGGGGAVGLDLGVLYSEVQCIMGNGHNKTDITENIIFPQLCWRAVTS